KTTAMHGLIEEFYQGIQGFLGAYFLFLALMNAVAAFYVWERRHRRDLALVWLTVAMAFVLISAIVFGGALEVVAMPQAVRDFVDVYLANAVMYSVGTLGGLIALFAFRRFFVKPVVAWSMLNLSLLLMGMSVIDRDFALIVTKPDNVPIVAMVFLLGFFTWLATNRAVQ